ncbi:hypothetical protein GX408_14575 [bacterium]|nr:hypothetical protein [bacterium]
MDLVLGVDLGTSYFKLGLFDAQGRLCGLSRAKVTKDNGDGTRAELPVDRFWHLLREGVQLACYQANASCDCIKAVSYASQANSFILLDRAHEPLTPLILWCDERARDNPAVDHLFDQELFLERTGLGVHCNHQFCLAKILWFQQHHAALWSRARHLLTLSDYFTFCLTGETVSDMGTASLLGLLDIHRLEWLRSIVDLGSVALPRPLRPGSPAGGVSRRGAALLGLTAGIPLVIGSLDHHMAGLGAGLDVIADMSESCGTVLACVRTIPAFHPFQDACTGVDFKPGRFFQLVFDGNGAAGLEWYQQNHAAGFTLAALEQQASTVPIGSEGLLARPQACSYPGLDGFLHKKALHRHGHFYRALLESTALSSKRLIERFSADAAPERVVATGGGAESELWLQIKADLSGLEYVTSQGRAPAAMGAAMLAAVAAGWFVDLSSATRQWIKLNKRYVPDPERHDRYQRWYQAMSQ